MKKLYIILSIILFANKLIFGINTILDIEIKDANTEKLVLSKVINNKNYIIDTLKLNKGKSKITLNITEPDFYKLDNINTENGLLLVINGGEKIKIKAENEIYKNYKIEGSNESKLLNEYFIKLNLTKDDAFKKKISDEFVENNNNSIISFAAINNVSNSEKHIRLMEAGLKKRFPKSKYYISILQTLQEIDKKKSSPNIGNIAPEISLSDKNGKTRNLSSLRGNYVLIDFWASWCGPCRRENPNVVKIYNKLKADKKNFEIYSISFDNKKEKWLEAINIDKLTWDNHVSELNGWTSTPGRDYRINSIPSTFLIDPQGKIIAINLRSTELADKLNEIFYNK